MNDNVRHTIQTQSEKLQADIEKAERKLKRKPKKDENIVAAEARLKKTYQALWTAYGDRDGFFKAPDGQEFHGTLDGRNLRAMEARIEKMMEDLKWMQNNLRTMRERKENIDEVIQGILDDIGRQQRYIERLQEERKIELMKQQVREASKDLNRVEKELNLPEGVTLEDFGRAMK